MKLKYQCLKKYEVLLTWMIIKMESTKYNAFLFMLLMAAVGMSLIDKFCQLMWGKILCHQVSELSKISVG